MNSSTSSPAPRPAEFQAHIYNAFLQGRTSDVALRIRASWDAIYKCHRVVLIQAEFFRHLFTGGFVESEGTVTSPGSHVSSDLVEVVFDDINITRAAFELCITRLYGGGPPLFIDPAIIPTPSHPLTPSFPDPLPLTQPPPDHQPATPRFLLSLLAVSIYLSMPSLAAEALSSVTSTIGPFTVMDYLRFACGQGIGPPQEGDVDPLVGLEHVAQLVKPDSDKCNPPSIGTSPSTQDRDVEYFSQNLEALSVEDQLRTPHAGGAVHGVDLSVEKEDPAELSPVPDSPTSPHNETGSNLSFSYGAVSDKIGEACVCWLARWGADLLLYEQNAAGIPKQPVPFMPVATPPRAIGRRSTVSGWRTPNPDVVYSPPLKLPPIWRRGGLTAAWVRALVSSDIFFIKGEKERYDLAKTVVELRRDEGIIEEEEVEWAKLFTEGIYYANMTFDDLLYLSHDRSPSTGRAYVPERVIQAAYWTQSMLRHKIVGSFPSSPPASPTGASRNKELGICVSRKDIVEALSRAEKNEETSTYWPVPGPSSMRMGECAGAENLFINEVFGLSSASSKHQGPSRSSMSYSTFFGLKNARCTTIESASSSPSDATRWVPYPPYRFGVEFWDVDSLREKSHLYSQTIWYAGSLFNVFVQMFRKKAHGPQLGVYLHRQSSVDPIPPLSMPSGSAPTENLVEHNYSISHTRNLPSPSPMNTSPTYPTQYSFSGLPMIPSPRSSTPVQGSPSSSSLSGSGLPVNGPPIVPQQPYRDPRAQVSAYFAIACASATGSSVTRFTSNPDDFSISQSWGWRSSSLRAEIRLDADKTPDPSISSLSGDASISSLRITVILGVV
ncbi:hypothetical protein F5148DRAFT_1163765 [Russula earlei]|uniref:Uncharacterized protein n=1 Tax=Russula earlei TaxID=71964 RepID=A0ACC0UKM7_9AGAM|nr:hypothetical protein F5148DRAFT_1163765 [Russula earlei]